MSESETIPVAPAMHVTFVMCSHPDYLAVVRATVNQVAVTVGCDEKQAMALTMAVDEALANVIRHAYHGRTDGRIELQCLVTADELQFRLRDTGEAPDLARICAHREGCDQIGGLGTHIIRDVMDTVSYQSLPDGNWLTASRRIRRPA